jgi:two-component system, chemotaxis family, chemotaxis protein CheY
MALRALLVDDSSVMRKMIITALKTSGVLLCDIFEADNGQAGLQALDQNEVDFVLLDINMPVMNGEEMFDQMKKDPRFKDLPVIFISSESNPERIELLEKRGSRFVQKPFTPKLLGETIKISVKGGQ